MESSPRTSTTHFEDMPTEAMATILWRSDLIAITLSILVTYVTSTVIYRLYFHPLAKFPGPFWAKVSTIPSWWQTRNQSRHLWLLKLQEEYGVAFRHRPDSVCVNTPNAYRDIYGPRGNVRKGDSYKFWHRTVDAQNTWNTTSIKAHARKRRVLNHAFSEAALRSAEPFIHSNIDRWLILLGQHKTVGQIWTESIDMADQVSYLVFDILGDLCFGRCFDMKEPGNNLRHVIDMMVAYIETGNPIIWSPLGSLWIWLKPRGLDRILAFVTPAKIKAWDAFVANCQKERAQKQYESKRMAHSEIRKDFFHWLFEAKDPDTGEGYTLTELNAECEVLTVAGSDTTATVLSALFFYLCRNPHVQERLAKEIERAFPSYDDIRSGAALQSCAYLTAVLHEALRMSTPIAADLHRQVLAGGTTIDGHYLPEGSMVASTSWSLHYNTDYYPEPTKFLPERWIVGEAGSTEESVKLADSAACPFSMGPRGCPGKNVAWLEMRLVLTKAIWKYEIMQEPDNKLGGGRADGEWGRRNEDQYQTYDSFVSNRKGPIVRLKERFRD
ncbi:hypothetical protein HBH70_033540 [Parastagonospora nodorum]|nr:hypothetical protein HBH53_040970 [Parastagonospora nodorum]KAH4036458.1 hypothetical protein HBI09_073200 [Parastagonospora nodorum]KAH4604431.1 hypothetical protein HBH82_132150 [Parastagonospora nodorum]KAH4690266.1 hypothetical protein HBH78_090680 [Parastagonospora nodorum]KAH4705143.1 hypothetical protein HBH67_090420 [Parastagonospora nodorum]